MMRLSRRECLAFTAAAFPAFSQEPAAGKLLVATRQSRDPDFAQSVILLIHYSRQGAIGLMINRPWDVPVTRLFPELTQSKAKLWQGGPIALGVRGLLRSPSKPEQADPVLAGVYAISSVKTLEGMLAANTPSDAFRVYGGSTGWSVEQLKSEISRGLWRVVPADARAVFDPHPATLWSRLNAR
ncbi:MAG: YqgE/AlgH family protein [Acidobacteriia bacterium]|nr:YqgE/AlgH family protein [Terriglobia bacterium]